MGNHPWNSSAVDRSARVAMTDSGRVALNNQPVSSPRWRAKGTLAQVETSWTLKWRWSVDGQGWKWNGWRVSGCARRRCEWQTQILTGGENELGVEEDLQSAARWGADQSPGWTNGRWAKRRRAGRPGGAGKDALSEWANLSACCLGCRWVGVEPGWGWGQGAGVNHQVLSRLWNRRRPVSAPLSDISRTVLGKAVGTARTTSTALQPEPENLLFYFLLILLWSVDWGVDAGNLNDKSVRKIYRPDFKVKLHLLRFVFWSNLKQTFNSFTFINVVFSQATFLSVLSGADAFSELLLL